MNKIKKILIFIGKHRFPKHIIGIIDFLSSLLSINFFTIHAKIILKIQGCSYGRRLKADGRLLVRSQQWGGISIGSNFLINSRPGANLVGLTNPTILSSEGTGRIEIGNYVGMSSAVISSRVSVEIGNHVKIGANARIFDHDFHSLNALDRRNQNQDFQGTKCSPVKIGNDVLIGTNSIILKGVVIGDRCCIGAGSIVSLKSIPCDSLVAGNPAKIIKTLERQRNNT